MASDFHSSNSGPQQPGLPAFVICDRLPEGCAAYPVSDDKQAPLVNAGEWVVVDLENREPAEGELFVIQWNVGGPTSVIECKWVWQMKVWAVGARHRVCNGPALGWGSQGDFIGDWGYSSGQLQTRILGKVVAILQSAVIEPEPHLL